MFLGTNLCDDDCDQLSNARACCIRVYLTLYVYSTVLYIKLSRSIYSSKFYVYLLKYAIENYINNISKLNPNQRLHD